MFNLLSSSLERLTLKKNSVIGPRFVAIDDLDVKHKKVVVKGVAEPLYSDTKLVQLYDNKNEDVTRVKVLMTKEEAMRLLSKCNSRGALHFKDVAAELEQIPAARFSLVCPDSLNREATLKSIPEEF